MSRILLFQIQDSPTAFVLENIEHIIGFQKQKNFPIGFNYPKNTVLILNL